MTTMIMTDSLAKRFGPIRAVNGISMTVRRGEVLGFLGPNGAGKSTTMKMIVGYLPPDAGRAEVCGHDVGRAPIAAKRVIGYLPEGAPAYPDMTAREFLGFIAEVRGFAGAERGVRIARAVEQTQLAGVLEQPIDTLSKGYKRRVGLAQALLHDPPVLILDEPTDGLDPNQKHEVRALITSMAAEKAIIISTHILEEVEAVCTRALIIAGGRIVADGTPAELEGRSRYHNAVTLLIDTDKAEPARALLAGLAPVAAVEPAVLADGRVSLTVLPRDGLSIAGTVADAVRNQGWAVHDVRRERGRLDEVFRTITQASAAASADPKAA